MTLFGDDARNAKIGVATALMLAVGAYYAWIATTQVTGYRESVAQHLDGQVLVFPLWDVTAIDGPDRYRISKVIRDVPMVGDATVLHVGDTISVMGAFRDADAAVVETAREIHILRRWKERLGVLGFLLAAAAAPVAFRIRNRRIEERG